MKTIANIVAWVLAVVLAAVFLFAGGIKLLSRPAMIHEFAQVGMGQWFRYFTGILEVTGAIGILIPKYRFWASLQLAIVMVGATAANLTVLHLPSVSRLTALLLLAALTLAWLRWPQSVSKPFLNSPAHPENAPHRL